MVRSLIRNQAPTCENAALNAPSSSSAAPGAAVEADSDLATIVVAWDKLPDAVKAGIVAMVKAVRASDG
jgi:hypothetical protein